MLPHLPVKLLACWSPAQRLLTRLFTQFSSHQLSACQDSIVCSQLCLCFLRLFIELHNCMIRQWYVIAKRVVASSKPIWNAWEKCHKGESLKLIHYHIRCEWDHCKNFLNDHRNVEKTLESPLNCKEIKSVNPKGNQSWIFIGRTDAEAEAPVL